MGHCAFEAGEETAIGAAGLWAVGDLPAYGGLGEGGFGGDLSWWWLGPFREGGRTSWPDGPDGDLLPCVL